MSPICPQRGVRLTVFAATSAFRRVMSSASSDRAVPLVREYRLAGRRQIQRSSAPLGPSAGGRARSRLDLAGADEGDATVVLAAAFGVRASCPSVARRWRACGGSAETPAPPTAKGHSGVRASRPDARSLVKGGVSTGCPRSWIRRERASQAGCGGTALAAERSSDAHDADDSYRRNARQRRGSEICNQSCARRRPVLGRSGRDCVEIRFRYGCRRRGLRRRLQQLAQSDGPSRIRRQIQVTVL